VNLARDQALVTLSAFKHFVQTWILWVVPLIRTLTLCRLGRNCRGDFPTILDPAPPFRRIIPRLLYCRPETGPFPHISHTFDIIVAFKLML
jgi:hypothetical protein